ncbi:23505_t:CDS:2, partial [Gigaspora rosea]
QLPQNNVENLQHSKDNIVNKEVKKKGSFIKPVQDDHCDKQTIRPNIGITALDNDVNDGYQTHNKSHVNDDITDWINENKEKWTNDDISQASSSTNTVQPEKGNALKTSRNSHNDSE